MLTLEFKVYTEIIMTRVTVPVGEDIGFLPGTEEEKMNPWMGALEDNLDVLNKTDDEAGEWGRAAPRATSSGRGSRSRASTSCAGARSSTSSSSSTRRRT
jgi:predicted ribonuclease YlaK